MARQLRCLVVGAGLSGSTAARLLADHGHDVTIIDQRCHVAGNAYDYVNSNNIRIHAFGPHIFHTSDRWVMEFLSRFTDWVPYQHRVKCLDPQGDLQDFPPSAAVLHQHGESWVLDTFYRPYSYKMWGMDLEDLATTVLARVRDRDPDQSGYFKDQYQCLPQHGYTQMVCRMLDHGNIKLTLNLSYAHSMLEQYDVIFSSMSIDQYHDYVLGRLPYRSLKFTHWEVYAPPSADVPVVNFTTQTKYTRYTDWRLFPNQPHGYRDLSGVVTLEQPCDASENHDERYYPVPDRQGHHRRLYQRYRDIATPKVIFIGRCGLYSYLDMHQAVSSTRARVCNFLQHR